MGTNQMTVSTIVFVPFNMVGPSQSFVIGPTFTVFHLEPASYHFCCQKSKWCKSKYTCMKNSILTQDKLIFVCITTDVL